MGKILDKRSQGAEIPADWAVDEDGAPVTDPHKVNALVPIAGANGIWTYDDGRHLLEEYFLEYRW